MKKIPPKSQLEILTQQIVRAKIYYDLWWFSVGEGTRPKIAETLNEYSEFFRFDIHAHFVCMIVHCAVVWDRPGGAISLPKWADENLDAKRFSDHKQLKQRIVNLEGSASGIVTIRNEAIAHRSATYNYETAFQRAGVVPDNLPDMMASWLGVANELRSAIDAKQEKVEFRDLPLNVLRELIHRLGGPDLRPRSTLDGVLGH